MPSYPGNHTAYDSNNPQVDASQGAYWFIHTGEYQPKVGTKNVVKHEEEYPNYNSKYSPDSP